MLGTMLSGKEYLSGQLGSAVPAVFPLSLAHLPSAYRPLEGRLEEAALMLLCASCSAATKTLDHYSIVLVANTKHSSVSAATRKVNSFPDRLNTVSW